jgi:hypothetical protein
MKITRTIRGFLIRGTGMEPWATDADAEKHFDGLHPRVQEACRAFVDSKKDDDEDVDAGADAERRYPASGPGRQASPNMAGSLAGPYQHSHLATIDVPTEYNIVCGWQELERGARVNWRQNPTTLAQKPDAVEFDAAKFSEDEARAWLSARHLRPTGFQADSNGDGTSRAAANGNWVERARARVAALNGGVAALPRSQNWSDREEVNLQAALSDAGLVQRTAEIDDVTRAGAELEYCFALDRACTSLDTAMGRR